MPRQLPWLNKRGASAAQAKDAPKASKKKSTVSNIDDDFFDGTVLASTSKGKGRAVPDYEASDDDLPTLSSEPSTARKKSKGDRAVRKERAPSSSPPAMADFEQPPIESMYKGFSKFDLRDDEWMMVEDEFLETAKLFTRHLHIAEYKRLKERIESKKKEADIARPVVAGAKLSFEGTMKDKARVQEKKQIKAIRNVFASQDDEDEDDDASSMRPPPRKAISSLSSSHPDGNSTSKRITNAYPARGDTDSDHDDDLDAPQRPARLTAASRTTSTTVPSNSGAPTLSNNTTKTSPPFAKPAPPKPPPPPLPATKPPRSTRPTRATPFDMLDDYTPRKPHNNPSALDQQQQRKPHAPSQSLSLSLSSLSSTSVMQSPSTPVAAAPNEAKSSRPRRSVDLFDDWGGAGGGRKKTQGSESTSTSTSTDRDWLAKRRVERDKEEEQDKDKSPEEKKKKRKAVKLDDIPTFLV